MKQKTIEILIEVEEIICLRKPVKKLSAMTAGPLMEIKDPAAKICPHCGRKISEAAETEIEIYPG